MKINSIIDLVKDLDTSRQTKNLNKLLIRILLHLQVEFSKDKKVIGVIVSSRHPSNDGTYRKAKKTLEDSLSSKVKGFRIEKKNIAIKYDPIKDKIL